MKKVCVLFLFLVTSTPFFAGRNNSADKIVRCVQLDPLEKVFTETSYFVENNDTAAVAKGETATFQFVIRSALPVCDLKIEVGDLINGNRHIAVTQKAFVGYVRAGNHTIEHSKDAVFPVSDYYPDCLQEVESVDVPFMQNQPVWASYAIPRDVAAGDYSATLVFTGKADGKPFKITKQVSAKVYPVTLPEQSLWVTNWFTTDEWILAKMNGNKPVEMFSDRYWELLTEMAHVMRDHRQNTYLIWKQRASYWNPYDWEWVCDVEYTDGKYTFDFTNFDKTVELLIREGGLKRIEGAHISRGGWVGIPKIGYKPMDDPAVPEFLSQFLPALYEHLKTKGWTDIYMQHIFDEAGDGNAGVHTRIAEMVKKYMPGIPVIDAVMSHKVDINVWVPKIDHYCHEKAFFQERQAAGDEVWYYTCNYPQGDYANRFLEHPLLNTRLQHWINYRFHLTGYLHWGFNWWGSGPADFAISTNPLVFFTIINKYRSTDPADFSTSTEPAGDAWIVYPAEGKIYSSIRLAAMRDGIADYELLKLLEQKAPDKAKQLAGDLIRDDGYPRYSYWVRSFNRNMHFRATRLELLKCLSE